MSQVLSQVVASGRGELDARERNAEKRIELEDVKRKVQFECAFGELRDIMKILEEKEEFDIADKVECVYQRLCEIARLCR